jgi:uncharacterized repeat protein (TIGR03943 family)
VRNVASNWGSSPSLLQRFAPWDLVSAALLLGMAVMLASTILRGTLNLYINVVLQPLTYLSVAILGLQLVALGLAKLRGSSDPLPHACDSGCCRVEPAGSLTGRQRLAVVALSVPIVLGLLVPPQVLGSTAIGDQDITTGATVPTGFSQSISNFDMNRAYEPAGTQADPLKRNVLQWRRVLSSVRDPVATFSGQPMDVVGFVHRAPTTPPDQFNLARFVIRCCIVDASPVALPVQTSEAGSLPLDTWVRVQGAFAAGTVNGQRGLVITPTRIEPVPQPTRPYINGFIQDE